MVVTTEKRIKKTKINSKTTNKILSFNGGKIKRNEGEKKKKKK